MNLAMKSLALLNIFLLYKDVLCIPLADFYPFGEGGPDAAVGRNDDGSSPLITLSSNFPFFDENFRNIYVNTNGVISFTTSISQYTPDSFPLFGSQELIAPYWADVDTRGTGVIWYRETTDPDLLERADSEIRQAFPTLIRYASEFLFIATWDRVGYYDSATDRTNTFQAILATDGLQSFVIFLYADGEIQWTTGDASGGRGGLGGTPAQVGFNAGDGLRYAAIPQSQTSEILNIASTSNIGSPGVWVFRTDEDAVVIAGCSDLYVPGPIRENGTEVEVTTISVIPFPRYGSVLGGTLIQVFGPCFDALVNSSITCHFDEIQTRGLYADEDYIVCVLPSLEVVGRVGFKITVPDLLIESEKVTFYSLDTENADIVSSDADEDQFYVSEDTVTVLWDSDMLLPAALVEDIEVSVNIDLILIDTESGDVDVLFNLAESVPNDGIYDVTIPEYDDISSVLIQISLAEIVAPSTIPSYLRELFNELKGKVKQWSKVVTISGSNFLRELCLEWSEEQPEGIGDEILAWLPPCPPTVRRARADSVFEEEDLGDEFRENFHPGTASCFRQVVFTSENEGSGQQCCYDDDGELVVGPPGGGTVDLYAPTGFFNLIGKWRHFYHDVRPFYYCCKGEFSDCREYYKHRPSDDGSRYVLQPPACVYGDPHMVTLDGFKYTFNGKGEFTLVQHEDELFTLQARMEEAEDSNGLAVRATVFTAIAAKQDDSDTVQFELSRRGLDALVNGERVVFDDLQKQEFTNVTVSDMGNQTLSALFSSGAYVQAKVENGIISVLLVSLSDTYRNSTSGLMGVFNGDMTDDLMRRNSSEYLPLNSTIEMIHEFGLGWIISHVNQSLFTYQRGQSWQNFHDPYFTPTFSPVFGDPILEAEAILACNNDTFCLYDIAATGRMDIGLSTLDGSMGFEEILRLSYPVVCNPPCVNGGACVANDTCNCQFGYEGDRCTSPVYSVCDVNRCENGGTCIKQGVSYSCDCPSSYTGILCETRVPSDDDDDDDNRTLIIAIAAAVAGALVAAVLIGVLCCTVICCCRKGAKPVAEDKRDLIVNNPGYEGPPAEVEHPFAAGSPALVYQNVSYQPNQQNMVQIQGGNAYQAGNQMVPKSYI